MSARLQDELTGLITVLALALLALVTNRKHHLSA
jgi:hypothetical protein